MKHEERGLVLLLILLVGATCGVGCGQGARPAEASGAQAEEQGKRASRVRRLLVLPRKPTNIRDWMKAHGWETQRGDPEHFRVDAKRLFMVSRKDSVAIGLRRGFPFDPAKWPRIRVTFRVLRLPERTDLTRKSGDDAAFRLFVAFDRDKGWFHPPHTIAYAWTGNVVPGRVIQSAHFDNVRYLSIGRGAPEREEDGQPKWITIERDLAADYRKVFATAKEPVPAIKGILLKCDSNNTATAAAAEVARVELMAPPKPTERREGR
jgi:hypothetical protein